jgi:hypothetical protein
MYHGRPTIVRDPETGRERLLTVFRPSERLLMHAIDAWDRIVRERRARAAAVEAARTAAAGEPTAQPEDDDEPEDLTGPYDFSRLPKEEVQQVRALLLKARGRTA